MKVNRDSIFFVAPRIMLSRKVLSSRRYFDNFPRDVIGSCWSSSTCRSENRYWLLTEIEGMVSGERSPTLNTVLLGTSNPHSWLEKEKENVLN